MEASTGLNAATVIFAALCVFAIGYRFYGLFLAQKVLNLNDARETPAVKYADGASITLNGADVNLYAVWTKVWNVMFPNMPKDAAITVKQGETVTIKVEGDDEEAAAEAIQKFLSENV